MTRYLVTDQQLRQAIHSAIRALDLSKQDEHYTIAEVSYKVLELLASSKTTESEQTENPKQDADREIDTSEYPFIQLEADELVRMICDAYQTGDFCTPMKFITASPKPVDGIPPVSYCPRCGALIWPDTTQRCINGQPENDTEYYRRILEIYKNNPDPLFCHNCGQRFKYVGQDQLAYKHQSNRADILRTLKLKAETQPTFDLAEVNQ